MNYKQNNRESLLFLKDPCHPLLKKLRTKTTGTYFHSLLVSELAASAAMKFKQADPLLAQIGWMYHDIGKIAEPDSYAENQEDGNYPFKPEIIITHVEKSIELAKAFNIPEKIQRFMATHHWTQQPPQIKNNTFNTYPESFKPQTIEETLVMLADSCEAAVRSLTNRSSINIKNIVNKVFNDKIQQDQLRDSVLIHDNLEDVKDEFLNVFNSLYHRRHATE